jgi:hypothetical protein
VERPRPSAPGRLPRVSSRVGHRRAANWQRPNLGPSKTGGQSEGWFHQTRLISRISAWNPDRRLLHPGSASVSNNRNVNRADKEGSKGAIPPAPNPRTNSPGSSSGGAASGCPPGARLRPLACGASRRSRARLRPPGPNRTRLLRHWAERQESGARSARWRRSCPGPRPSARTAAPCELVSLSRRLWQRLERRFSCG